MANASEPHYEPAATSSAAPEPEGLASRFLAQARRAGEHVQTSAADLTSKVGDLKEQAAAAASELGDLTKAKVGELKEAGFIALEEALADFNAALPAASEAGYTLHGLSIALALPPQATATFATSGNVSAENVERVLAAHADRKFTTMLVKSLFQAWQVQTKVHVAGLKPSSLSVVIGLSPSVSINFA
jgi:hypothetical protein